jgi:hypothetical protein
MQMRFRLLLLAITNYKREAYNMKSELKIVVPREP